MKCAEVRDVSRQVWDAPRIRQRIDRGRERKWSELNLIWAICAAWLFGMNCRTRYACETFFNGMRAMIDPTLSEHSERVAKQEGRTSTR